jgi:hypothetical protein
MINPKNNGKLRLRLGPKKAARRKTEQKKTHPLTVTTTRWMRKETVPKRQRHEPKKNPNNTTEEKITAGK